MVKRKDSERKIKRLIVADDRVTNNDGDATAHCPCDRSGRNDFAVPGYRWIDGSACTVIFMPVGRHSKYFKLYKLVYLYKYLQVLIM